MDNAVEPAPLVAPGRFAELTGMTRERLRAWERRYGFPDPVRRDGGPRRYRLADVQRVVAVRRAHEEGVPIAAAIEGARREDPPGLAATAFRATVERSPVPIALLSGPAPLRTEYANAALRTMPAPPVAGEELVATCPALDGTRLVALLQEHFARELPPTEVAHPAWLGDGDAEVRSVVLRLPADPGARPLVALVGLQTATEHEALVALVEQEEELAELRRRTERHERWLDALAGLAVELRDEPAADVAGRAVEIVMRQTRAVDAALALYVGGELDLGRGRRGALGPGRMVVAGDADLAVALRDRESLWLGRDAATLLGVPDGLHAHGLPIAVGGEVLALLVLAFDEVEPRDDDNHRLLASLSAALGFVLLRDRLAGAVSLPPPPASGSASGG